MSRTTLGDEYDVEQVYRSCSGGVIHLSDDCERIPSGTDAIPSDAAAVPVGFYDLCEFCDPDAEPNTGTRPDKEGWPV